MHVSLCISSVLVLIAGATLAAVEDQAPRLDASSPVEPHASLHNAIIIRPRAVTADPLALARVMKPMPEPYDGVGATWEERLEYNPYPGFGIEWSSIPKAAHRLPCTVEIGATWEAAFDTLARTMDGVWRLRGKVVEYIPAAIAKKLHASLDGNTASAGTRSQVVAWFGKQTGLAFAGHPALLDEGTTFTWSTDTATQEAWLDGLAAALGVTAILQFDGNVILYQAPAVVPLNTAPEFLSEVPRLVYGPPPAARLDAKQRFDFDKTPFSQAVERLERALQYPIEVEPPLASLPPVTLRVENMRLRDVLLFVAKLSGLEVVTLPDRVRLIAARADGK